jgi:hypothetical protein
MTRTDPVPPPQWAKAVAIAPPEGTRLILASENLLDTWGRRTHDGYALRVDWGEPNEHGWYTPTFTIDYTDRLQQPAQYFDPLTVMVGEFARDFVAPEQRIDAIDRLYVLLHEAHAASQERPQPANGWLEGYTEGVRREQRASSQERPSIDVERLAEAIANVDPAMKAYWSRDDWKGTDRKFAAEILKELSRLSSPEPVERLDAVATDTPEEPER